MTAILSYLHSSMDRFEATVNLLFFHRLQYLHSSMDRFEVKVTSTTFCTSAIYIPVWIDLKTHPRTVTTTALTDLHSSMDRFEDRNYRFEETYGYIYIPVWIDLKAFPFIFSRCFRDIYIPVWIDLKSHASIKFSLPFSFTFQYG